MAENKTDLFPIAILLILAALFATVISCKGDPADFPRKDLITQDFAASISDTSGFWIAFNFETLVRDPELGPGILPLMESSSSQLESSLPFWDHIKYIHGMAFYGKNTGFFQSPILSSDSVLYFLLEMDSRALMEFLDEVAEKTIIHGIPVYVTKKGDQDGSSEGAEFFNNGYVIAVASDNELYYGTLEMVQRVLELRDKFSPSREKEVLIPVSDQTLAVMAFDLDTIRADILKLRDDEEMTAEEHRLRELTDKIEDIFWSMSLEGDSMITEIAIKAQQLDRASLEEISRELGDQFAIPADGSTKPEAIFESWGIRLRITAPKADFMRQLGGGF
ncbi:MAG: hypothetical protein EHM28_11440 [Spirochaetaceae bacterium]|nr:MAG: hypothetical protein EHM28_11440 [Spirochaetaceae bacterium]